MDLVDVLAEELTEYLEKLFEKIPQDERRLWKIMANKIGNIQLFLKALERYSTEENAHYDVVDILKEIAKNEPIIAAKLALYFYQKTKYVYVYLGNIIDALDESSIQNSREALRQVFYYSPRDVKRDAFFSLAAKLDEEQLMNLLIIGLALGIISLHGFVRLLIREKPHLLCGKLKEILNAMAQDELIEFLNDIADDFKLIVEHLSLGDIKTLVRKIHENDLDDVHHKLIKALLEKSPMHLESLIISMPHLYKKYYIPDEIVVRLAETSGHIMNELIGILKKKPEQREYLLKMHQEYIEVILLKRIAEQTVSIEDIELFARTSNNFKERYEEAFNRALAWYIREEHFSSFIISRFIDVAPETLRNALLKALNKTIPESIDECIKELNKKVPDKRKPRDIELVEKILRELKAKGKIDLRSLSRKLNTKINTLEPLAKNLHKNKVAQYDAKTKTLKKTTLTDTMLQSLL